MQLWYDEQEIVEEKKEKKIDVGSFHEHVPFRYLLFYSYSLALDTRFPTLYVNICQVFSRTNEYLQIMHGTRMR